MTTRNTLTALRTFAATVIALAVFSASANAASIAVPNGDFETGPRAAGQDNSVPPSWTATGLFGTLRPDALGFYDETNPGYAADPHGDFVAFAQGGATLSQTLGDTYQSLTQYTLSVLVGDSYEGVGGNYTVNLKAGATVLGTTGSTPFPGTAYTDETATVVFITPFSGGPIGQAITIEIIADTGATKTFDNVTLDGTSVPAPSALASGLITMALVGARRRRRA